MSHRRGDSFYSPQCQEEGGAGRTFLEVLWGRVTTVQVMYSTRQQCVDLTEMFSRTESGITRQQFKDNIGQIFSYSLPFLRPGLKLWILCQDSTSHFTVLYFANSSESRFTSYLPTLVRNLLFSKISPSELDCRKAPGACTQAVLPAVLFKSRMASEVLRLGA